MHELLLAPDNSVNGGYDNAPRLAEGEHGDVEFAHCYPLRILVAEDSYINRQLLMAMLRALGYDAVSCGNDDELLTAALLGDFDLLLDDLDMSGMNGFERTQLIRRAGMPMNVVGMTDGSLELSREQCLRAGLDEYLAKPVTLGDLKRVLREAAMVSGAPAAASASSPA